MRIIALPMPELSDTAATPDGIDFTYYLAAAKLASQLKPIGIALYGASQVRHRGAHPVDPRGHVGVRLGKAVAGQPPRSRVARRVRDPRPGCVDASPLILAEDSRDAISAQAAASSSQGGLGVWEETPTTHRQMARADCDRMVFAANRSIHCGGGSARPGEPFAAIGRLWAAFSSRRVNKRFQNNPDGAPWAMIPQREDV